MPGSSDPLEALYSQDEELNPLGHEIISRKLDPSELSIPDNLNWSSKWDSDRLGFLFVLDKRLKERDGDGDERLRKMSEAVSVLLECVGEDPEREGLLKTPERYAKALLYFTKGYNDRIEDVINGALFQENHDEMVIVRDIEIFSLCEHHLVPFTGRVRKVRSGFVLSFIRFILDTFRIRMCWD